MINRNLQTKKPEPRLGQMISHFLSVMKLVHESTPPPIIKAFSTKVLNELAHYLAEVVHMINESDCLPANAGCVSTQSADLTDVRAVKAELSDRLATR